MIKNLVRLEHVVQDKIFHFVCDPDSPLPAIKEALFQFAAYVAHIEDNVKAQQEAAAKQAQESPKVEEQSNEPPKVEEQPKLAE